MYAFVLIFIIFQSFPALAERKFNCHFSTFIQMRHIPPYEVETLDIDQSMEIIKTLQVRQVKGFASALIGSVVGGIALMMIVIMTGLVF